MNRIHEFQISGNEYQGIRKQVAADAINRCVKQTGEAFFIPSSYTPSYDYPLVIWLHHEGSSERDVSQVLPHISLQNYVGVGVRGCRAAESSGQRFGWSDSPAAVAVSEHAILNAIDSAAHRFSINRRKVFLVGYCDGGSAALRIGLRHPNRFAGVATIGGAIPEGGRLFANLQAARELPLYLATYRDSAVWPVDQVCHQLRLLHAARLRAEVRQYPESGELCTRILADLNRWMMSVVLGTPITEEVVDQPFSKN